MDISLTTKVTLAMIAATILFRLGTESVAVSVYRDTYGRTKVVREQVSPFADPSIKTNVYELPPNMIIYDINFEK